MATATSNLHSPLLMADTVPNSVDYKGRPAVRSNHGRWFSALFIIWVEMAERIAFYGISSNLISFLTGKLGQSTAMAAVNINAWSGVASLLPIFGAVIADSFAGKFYTIIVSSVIYILGLGLLTLSAMLPSLSCPNQGRSIVGGQECSPHLQTVIFFIALYLVAAGQGGHKPCVQAFGADQFDGEDPGELKAKSSFFNWWYFGVCVGSLLGIGVLSYVQDNLSWGLGFGIPCIIMVISVLIFLFGTVTYRYNMKVEGESPFTRIGRVFVAAAQNWNTAPPEDGDNEEAQFHDGSRQFKFLDKALVAQEISNRIGKSCSKSNVEEAKAVLRLFPIWATTLIFAIVFSQPPTFFTKQGITLNRSVGSNFAIPAAALQSFIGIFIVIFLPIYDRVLVPVARKITGNPAGISMLQRIGTGLFISIIVMVLSTIIEKKRLETASQHGLIDLPDMTIPMSIWWLLPQYALFGISEAFTMVGLQEFFYDQVPNELRSVGLSLYLSIFGLGGLLSSLLVTLINKATSRGGKESWFSNNLNRAHLDYFYWLLAGLSSIAVGDFMHLGAYAAKIACTVDGRC
ncbi:protein NRT1/ PTR FAMILY 5.10-like isoform X1 [Chenopodium quinoa]|uniref:protein NRT1/ PTR FAMILY 5.10-like isoform X1 n=1 Tax=Chenopodium quinoa TaxID=63459 RepID=UPI000B776DF2|nr:protein NRT1/ PTR FAMILY 5.10-like isoform X1 [Chenopodium quinoa]